MVGNDAFLAVLIDLVISHTFRNEFLVKSYTPSPRLFQVSKCNLLVHADGYIGHGDKALVLFFSHSKRVKISSLNVA